MSTTTPDCCFSGASNMLSVDEAIASLLQHVQPTTVTERVALHDAANRILATDITSSINVPGFDNSAMDGYAFNSHDMERAQAKGLEITQRIPAGTTGTPLQSGSAARIFTGAPVPEGADTVTMQEICRIENNHMVLKKRLPQVPTSARVAMILQRATPSLNAVPCCELHNWDWHHPSAWLESMSTGG